MSSVTMSLSIDPETEIKLRNYCEKHIKTKRQVITAALELLMRETNVDTTDADAAVFVRQLRAFKRVYGKLPWEYSWP